MTRVACWVCAALLLAGVAGSPPISGQETPHSLPTEQVLDRWAAARGGRERLAAVRGLHLKGRIDTGGLHGTYERWTTPHGEYRTEFDLSSVLHQVTVFDGHEGWLLTASGAVQDLSGATLESVISSAYEASDSFLFAGRLAGSVVLMREDAALDAYVLRLIPDRGTPISVYLDRTTFLPVREESDGPMGTRTIRFSRWLEVAGIKVPATVTQSTGDARLDIAVTIEHADIDPIDASMFSRPIASASPVRFVSSRKAVIPASVYSEHAYVSVGVNGHEGGWFFIDSGAGQSVISRALAERIGLAFDGALAGQGTGAGANQMALARDVVLSVPGVEISTPSIAVWDFSAFLPVVGRAWDGLLGHDVISRLVVRVDYGHEQVTLFDPDTYVPEPRATPLALSFMGSLPVVHAVIRMPGRAPLDVECAVDSGASGLHLTTPFAAAQNVRASMARTMRTTSVGAGGGTEQVTGRLAGFQLGPYVLHGPVTSFSPDLHEGLLANSRIGALIGGEILQRFVVTFDYPHQRIWIEPTSHMDDPFPANESGMALVAQGADFRRFEVADVEVGSPADRAGVHRGDVLTEVDGAATRGLTLEDLEHLLARPGHVIRLSFERHHTMVRVRLKLSARI